MTASAFHFRDERGLRASISRHHQPEGAQVRERPILFSGPMVRALLDGRKTQTRRAVKPQPDSVKVFGAPVPYRMVLPPRDMPSAVYEKPIRCPYGVPGDRLWVREAWRLHERFSDVARIVYAASQGQSWTEMHEDFPVGLVGQRQPSAGFKPSIHMPRWASRLTLQITDVRVERLQDISEADARAEGITEHPCLGPYRGAGATYWTADGPHPDAPLKRTTPVDAYKALWEHINGEDGPGSWAANPWVWALTFEVVR